MKPLALPAVLAFLTATTAFAEVPAARVLDDAKAIDRVAEMAQGDLPQGVLNRIAARDIELLRGRRPDDTYEYARYERLEASRVSDSFSIQPTDPDHLSRVEVKAAFVYRVILEAPSRRLVVAKNRPLWIDHVEIEYLPQNSATAKTQSVKVGLSLAPGSARSIDVDDIPRQATVRVFARADKASGYGNLDVTLVQAKIFDDADSPYADAVASAKAIQRAVEHRDVASTRSNAQRMIAALEHFAAPVVRPVPEMVAARPQPQPMEGETQVRDERSGELALQLQSIEDLLTGSEAERRDGMDRLHQLLRRLRNP